MCLAGGEFGFITKNFFSGVVYKSDEAVIKLKEIFLKKIFFLEIQKQNAKNKELWKYLIKKSIELKIPLVATNENFFLTIIFLRLTMHY